MYFEISLRYIAVRGVLFQMLCFMGVFWGPWGGSFCDYIYDCRSIDYCLESVGGFYIYSQHPEGRMQDFCS